MNRLKTDFAFTFMIIFLLCIGSTDASDSKKVLVIPFVPNSEIVQSMADEATWILEKKMTLRQITVLDRVQFLNKNEKEFGLRESLSSENITSIQQQIWNANEIEWVIGGGLTYLGMEMDRREGALILGVSKVPIRVDLHVFIYNARSNKIIWQSEETSSLSMPVLRIFGFFRDPMPKSPRSMDALLHPPVCKIAAQLIDIIYNRSEESETGIRGQRDFKEKMNSWEQ